MYHGLSRDRSLKEPTILKCNFQICILGMVYLTHNIVTFQGQTLFWPSILPKQDIIIGTETWLHEGIKTQEFRAKAPHFFGYEGP